MSDSTGPIRAPSRLNAAALALALAGALGLAGSIWLMVDGFRVVALGGKLAIAIGFFVVVLSLIPGGVSAWLLFIARSLPSGDRVARVLAISTCVSYSVAALLSGSRNAWWVISAIMALSVAGLLTFDPVIVRFFTGPGAREYDQPTPLVAARTLLVVASACAVLVGVMFLPLAVFWATGVAWGLIFIVIGVALYALTRALATGNRSARVAVLLLSVAYVVIALIAGHGVPGVILPITLTLFVVGLQWLPSTSRRYFAEAQEPFSPVLRAIEAGVIGAIDAVHPVPPVEPRVGEPDGAA